MTNDIGILNPTSEHYCPFCGKTESDKSRAKHRFYLCGTEAWREGNGEWRARVGERCKG